MRFFKVLGVFAATALILGLLYASFSTSEIDAIIKSNESKEIKISKIKTVVEKKYAGINEMMLEIRKEQVEPNVTNKKIGIVLDRMVRLDQSLRAYVPDSLWDIISEIDTKNTTNLKELLTFSKTGWFTISEFGKKCDNNAWLLVQHADLDPDFQSKILFILDNHVKNGETDKINHAYLYDRVATGAGKLQRYGTQFIIVDGICTPSPIEDPEHVDKRRVSLGLVTMEKYKEICQKGLKTFSQ